MIIVSMLTVLAKISLVGDGVVELIEDNLMSLGRLRIWGESMFWATSSSSRLRFSHILPNGEPGSP